MIMSTDELNNNKWYMDANEQGDLAAVIVLTNSKAMIIKHSR